MGIYIKNEKAPKSCSSCFYAIHCDECIFKEIVLRSDEIIYRVGKKPDDCPITEVEDNE